MGAREEETGNVVSGPPLMGDQWWLISRVDGTALCCLLAPSWFKARDTGRELMGEESVSAELVREKKS